MMRIWRPYASIDAYQQLGPVLNIGLAKVFDVHGIEVHVQSLGDPRFPTWILTSRGHERFVIEPEFFVAGKREEFRQCESGFQQTGI